MSNEEQNQGQLHKPVVMRPKADCLDCKGSGGVQTGFEEYSTCPCVQAFGEPLGNEAQEKTVRDGVNGGEIGGLDAYQNILEP